VSQIRYLWGGWLLLIALIVPFVCVPTSAQAPRPPDNKLNLNAALVLSPEFCTTKIAKKQGNSRETFEVGKAACSEFPPALAEVFLSLVRVSNESSPGKAHVVLVPTIVDISATIPKTAFSDCELVVLVEWTVKDESGKTVWSESVQGTAKRHYGTAFNAGHNRKELTEDALKEVALQSASKMLVSPELRNLAGENN